MTDEVFNAGICMILSSIAFGWAILTISLAPLVILIGFIIWIVGIEGVLADIFFDSSRLIILIMFSIYISKLILEKIEVTVPKLHIEFTWAILGKYWEMSIETFQEADQDHIDNFSSSNDDKVFKYLPILAIVSITVGFASITIPLYFDIFENTWTLLPIVSLFIVPIITGGMIIILGFIIKMKRSVRSRLGQFCNSE